MYVQIDAPGVDVAATLTAVPGVTRVGRADQRVGLRRLRSRERART